MRPRKASKLAGGNRTPFKATETLMKTALVKPIESPARHEMEQQMKGMKNSVAQLFNPVIWYISIRTKSYPCHQLASIYGQYWIIPAFVELWISVVADLVEYQQHLNMKSLEQTSRSRPQRPSPETVLTTYKHRGVKGGYVLIIIKASRTCDFSCLPSSHHV